MTTDSLPTTFSSAIPSQWSSVAISTDLLSALRGGSYGRRSTQQSKSLLPQRPP